MGGAWGLVDAQDREHFPWRGPVEGDPQAWRGPLAAALGGVLGAAVGVWRWRAGAARAACALASAALGALALAQADALPLWSRTPFERAEGLLASAAAFGCALYAIAALASRLDGAVNAPVPGIAAARRARAGRGFAGGFALARAATLFFAAMHALQLAVDGRYRGFHWPLLAAPALMLLALRLAGERWPDDAREERWLAAIGVAAAIGIVVVEGPRNAQALVYAALLALLAASGAGRANTSAASSAAGVPRPAE
jgi:hypothetical protein